MRSPSPEVGLGGDLAPNAGATDGGNDSESEHDADRRRPVHKRDDDIGVGDGGDGTAAEPAGRRDATSSFGVGDAPGSVGALGPAGINAGGRDRSAGSAGRGRAGGRGGLNGTAARESFPPCDNTSHRAGRVGHGESLAPLAGAGAYPVRTPNGQGQRGVDNAGFEQRRSVGGAPWEAGEFRPHDLFHPPLPLGDYPAAPRLGYPHPPSGGPVGGVGTTHGPFGRSAYHAPPSGRFKDRALPADLDDAATIFLTRNDLARLVCADEFGPGPVNPDVGFVTNSLMYDPRFACESLRRARGAVVRLGVGQGVFQIAELAGGALPDGKTVCGGKTAVFILRAFDRSGRVFEQPANLGDLSNTVPALREWDTYLTACQNAAERNNGPPPPRVGDVELVRDALDWYGFFPPHTHASTIAHTRFDEVTVTTRRAHSRRTVPRLFTYYQSRIHITTDRLTLSALLGQGCSAPTAPAPVANTTCRFAEETRLEGTTAASSGRTPHLLLGRNETHRIAMMRTTTTPRRNDNAWVRGLRIEPDRRGTLATTTIPDTTKQPKAGGSSTRAETTAWWLGLRGNTCGGSNQRRAPRFWLRPIKQPWWLPGPRKTWTRRDT